MLQERNINHFWFSMFATVSSFNNVGFSLLDDNYVQISDRPALLLLMCFYIIAGNTGLPVFLRAIFATLGKLRPNNRAIRFVLDNPRCVRHKTPPALRILGLTSDMPLTPLLLAYCAFAAAALPRSSTRSSPLRWRSSCAATC